MNHYFLHCYYNNFANLPTFSSTDVNDFEFCLCKIEVFFFLGAKALSDKI